MASCTGDDRFLRLLPTLAGADQVSPDPKIVPILRPFEFSSLQINLPPAIDQAILGFAANIPDTELAEDGRAEQPHITVRQRLLTRQPQDVIALLAGRQRFEVTFGLTHVFMAPEDEIVHVDVDSYQLRALHDRVSTLLHRDPHTYHPHVTVAFVKPGCGEKYSGDDFLAGVTVPVRVLTYSGADGTMVDVPLVWSE